MAFITPNDLRFPNGMLNLNMFRGATEQQYSDALIGYVVSASSEVKRRVGAAAYDAPTPAQALIWNQAETHWAHYLGFKQLSVLASSLPVQASEVNLSATFPSGANLRQLAAAELLAFNTLVPPPIDDSWSLDEISSNDSEFTAEF